LNKGVLKKAALSLAEGAALPAPERLRVYALKRFDAQARWQVAHWLGSRTASGAPPIQVAAAFPSRVLRTDWTGLFEYPINFSYFSRSHTY
jgi:hypothetical protein